MCYLYFVSNRAKKEQAEQAEQGQAQAIAGYGCICGFKTLDKKEFTSHVFLAAKKDGKGTHKSIGRLNMQTGDVVMPPYVERTPEQLAISKYKATGPKAAKTREGTPVRVTELWEQATEIRLIPRIFQMNFTHTMRMAKVASMRVFEWPDLSWEDLIDTIFDNYFKEHGVILSGYIVMDEVEELKQKEEVPA